MRYVGATHEYLAVDGDGLLFVCLGDPTTVRPYDAVARRVGIHRSSCGE